MEEKKWEPGEELDTELINIILKIPKDSVRLNVTATILDDDLTPHKAEMILSVSDIMDARKDFLDNVEDGDEYDALYGLTDIGREYLRQLKESGGWEDTDDESEK